jgi:hypothetical protein
VHARRDIMRIHDIMEKINKTNAATKIQDAIRNKYAKLTMKITKMEKQLQKAEDMRNSTHLNMSELLFAIFVLNSITCIIFEWHFITLIT